MKGELGFGTPNSHFFQPTAQGIWMEVERFGRAMIAFDDPISLREDRQDMLSL